VVALGVLSQSDLLIHACGSAPARCAPECDLMTPVVFTVTLDTPAEQVVHQMLALKIHRLFVLDETGVLVGVISAIDVLRHLGP
jgi:CBS domain-containing protein